MNEQKAANIVDRLLRAAEEFAQRDPYPDQTRRTWSVWWDLVPEAASLFSEAVDDLVRSNATQLSRVDTARAVAYSTVPSLIALAVDEPGVDKAAIRSALHTKALTLANSSTSRRLQFIIENLVVDGEIPRFFGVHLTHPTDRELQELHDDPLIRSPRTSAIGLATVDAPGDSTMAFEYGVLHVERFLNLLQGCGADLVFRNFFPIHIIDRNPVEEDTTFRQRINGSFRATRRIRYGARELRFARAQGDLLSYLSQGHVEELVQATTKPATPILTAVVSSLETLGEACKPNLTTTRMLLTSSALEMLVGATASDQVSFRGQTAAIAERTVFLIGGQAVSERQSLDRRVTTLYRKGSGVRHGSRPSIATDDVVALANITRQVALALLLRPDLRDHQELDTWVQRMRYTTEPSPPSPR